MFHYFSFLIDSMCDLVDLIPQWRAHTVADYTLTGRFSKDRSISGLTSSPRSY